MASPHETPMISRQQRTCPECNVNTMRRNEAHKMCFDCLGHGPLSMRDLRCPLCTDWTAKHFVAATVKYVPSSQSKRDAIDIQRREGLTTSQDPNPIQEEETVDPDSVADNIPMDVSDPPPPPSVPVQVTPPPPPGYMPMSAEFLQANILTVLQQLGVGMPPAGESGGKRKDLGETMSQFSPSSLTAAKKSKQKEKNPYSLVGEPASMASSSVPSGSERSRFDRQTGVSTGVKSYETQPGVPHSSFTIVRDTGSLSTSEHRQSLDRTSIDTAPMLYPWQSTMGSQGAFPTQQAGLAASAGVRDTHGLLGAARQPGVMSAHRSVTSTFGSVMPPPRSHGLIDTRVSLAATDPSIVSHSVSGRDTIEGSTRDHDSSGDEEGIGEKKSAFRWAIQEIARLMGLPPTTMQVSTGHGRFAATPEKPMISLPLADHLIKHCRAINQKVMAKKEIGRSEPVFPSLSFKAKAIDTYASASTDSMISIPPKDDEHIGLLTKKKAIWSAPMKKARLNSWQTAAHHLMGQLSSADHLTNLVQDILDDAELPEATTERAQTALDVLLSTIHSAERTSASLSAHLDLTAREADLRLLDVSEVDAAELRSKPLFTGGTFGHVPRAAVLEMRQTRMNEALISHVAKSKPAPKGPPKKPAKAATVTSATTQQVQQQPFQTSAPPRRGGRGRGGRGRKSQAKST